MTLTELIDNLLKIEEEHDGSDVIIRYSDGDYNLARVAYQKGAKAVVIHPSKE